MNGSDVHLGDIVPRTIIPGYVVLSYVVSVIGCITALELLHRRHSYTGRYNWFLLAGAATAMGGVAIWSMHFIGMSAIVMAGGSEDLQIVYSPAYTVGSMLLAIGIVGLAFFVFSSSGSVTPIQIVGGGIICGSAICGMHYLGQAGMTNYWNVWDWRFVVGSAIIAVVAATTALGIFFWQKAVWTNTLWKRLLCALGLAAAVSLMHWVAILGNSYAWQGNLGVSSGWSKTDAVWVCGALAISCCGVILAFGVLWRYVGMLYAQKAQQVSVALAYWDPDGKIMLNSSGLLPSSKIARSFGQQSYKEHFDTDHPIFSWLFRASRNWHCISDFIPYMRQHARFEKLGDRSPSLDGNTAERYPSDPSITFKELFCLSVHDLAYALEFPLREAGVLYDRILDTGSITPQPRIFSPNAAAVRSDTSTGGTGESPLQSMTLGRGQLLFMVRKVNKYDALRLQSQGLTFAPVSNVLGDLAHSMQVTPTELKPFLDDLSVYHEMPRGTTPGVHLACFALKPRIGGFEVLARKDARNLTPSVKLSPGKLDRWQINFLSAYDDWDVQSLFMHWDSAQALSKLSQDQREFATAICLAMRQMQQRIGDKLFHKARLIATPLDGPCRANHKQVAEKDVSQNATIIAFRFMTDIHYVHPAISPDTFVPTRLFLTQQHCYPNSPDHHVFAARVRQELTFLLEAAEFHPAKAPSPDLEANRPHVHAHHTISRLSRVPTFLRPAKADTSIDITRFTTPPSRTSDLSFTSNTTASRPYRNRSIHNSDSKAPLVSNAAENPSSGGGIHVSKEIEVKITDALAENGVVGREKGEVGLSSVHSIGNGKHGEGMGIEMTEGFKTEIGVGNAVERESMMDVLMAICLGKAVRGEGFVW